MQGCVVEEGEKCQEYVEGKFETARLNLSPQIDFATATDISGILP